MIYNYPIDFSKLFGHMQILVHSSLFCFETAIYINVDVNVQLKILQPVISNFFLQKFKKKTDGEADQDHYIFWKIKL